LRGCHGKFKSHERVWSSNKCVVKVNVRNFKINKFGQKDRNYPNAHFILPTFTSNELTYIFDLAFKIHYLPKKDKNNDDEEIREKKKQPPHLIQYCAACHAGVCD